MNHPPNSRFNWFPDDVILQILSRLPIKSLFRIKCVCKLWYNLIADGHFTQLYNNISVKNPMMLVDAAESSSESKSRLICVDNLRGVSEISLDFIRDRVKVRASCNGLLCCSSLRDRGVYYVCNPMIKDYKLLPRSMERPFYLPDGDPTLIGLACNLSTQKYNVVFAGNRRRFAGRPERTFICLIYDSESNKWRKLESEQDDQFTRMNKNQVVYVNGALHWLTDTGSFVLVLDLNSDLWRKIYLPHEVSWADGNRIYLLEMDGCLSVIKISEAWMNIWVMRNYEKEDWHLVDKVSLRCIKGMVAAIFPICQSAEFILLATYKKLLVYQRNSKMWKEMFSVNSISKTVLFFSAQSFRSTLFSCR